MSFEDDIQGKNTQLYPVVEIDGTWYSTNNVTVEYEDVQYYCKPILMNIPSIKESVDVESRRFKISNVSLQFNNFSFEGVRFSDQLSETSLINKEATIYFKSQSDLKEVFKGIVRRISHDDEKVKVELEDLTEKKAHKDLPEMYGDNDYLPEKTRNKPKNIVYGYVDRCPLIKTGKEFIEFTQDGEGYEEDTLTELDIDYKPIAGLEPTEFSIGAHNFNSSGLVATSDRIGISSNSISDKSLESIPKIELLANKQGEITSSAFIRDFIGMNVFGGSQYVIKFYEGEDYLFPSDNIESLSHDIYYAFNSDGSPNYSQVGSQEMSDLADNSELGFSYTKDLTTNTGIRIQGYSDNDQTNYHYIRFNLNTLENDFDCETYIICKIRANPHEGTLDGYLPFLEGQSYPDGVDFDIDGWEAYSVWVGEIPVIASDSFSNSAGFQVDDNEYGRQIYLNGSMSFNNYSSGDEVELRQQKGNKEGLGYFHTLNEFSYLNIGAVKSHYDNGVDGSKNHIHDLFIQEAHLYHIATLNKLLGHDYYANIKGRINTFDDHPQLQVGSVDYFQENSEQVADFLDSSLFNEAPQYIQEYATVYPNLNTTDSAVLMNYIDQLYEVDFIQNPIDIIYDLVRGEIGHENIDVNEYEEAKLAHSDWKFGFTVNKKISSKKLIEDIAKSTKCFPKFKNDGSFGFNTVKDSYTVEGDDSDYAGAIPIKESEVISYSFKKTKPEQIYKKVTVSYNKDYAQDSYLKTTTPIDLGSDDYYGIEDSDDAHLEFESDYIRHKETADLLASFLSEQYKNDHLIFNLKLPLQYIDLEIGDLVKFETLFQGVKSYGITYTDTTDVNGQFRYPLFMVTSTTKNLDSVSVECMQLHHLEESLPTGTDYATYSGDDIEISGNVELIGGNMSQAINILVDDDYDYSGILSGSFYFKVSGIERPENPEFGDNDILAVSHQYSLNFDDGIPNHFTLRWANESDYNGDGIADDVNADIDVPFGLEEGQQITITLSSYTIPEPSSETPIGDVNNDSIVNVLDVVQMVNAILGDPNPNLDWNQADLNADGGLNILDVVQLVNNILTQD